MSESTAKQRLLEAALSLIWSHSYGSVGVDEICHFADVKKGSFYYAFKSKSDLATAAFEHYWEQKKAILDRFFAPQIDPLERFNGYCDWVVAEQTEQFRRGGKVLGCPFSSVGCELSTQDENIRQKAHELSDRVVGYIESAVRDLLKEGRIETGDPRELAREIYTYCTGVMTQAKIDNDIATVERIGPGIRRLLGLKLLTPNIK